MPVPKSRAPLPPMLVKIVRTHGGEPHRSTAWKVAYADFVTAMMAFFLLLWLYTFLPQDKKPEIADYFTPTVGVITDSGFGAKGGRDPDAKSGKALSDRSSGTVKSAIPMGPLATRNEAPNADAEEADAAGGARADGNSANKKVFMAISERIRQALEKIPDDVLQKSLLLPKPVDDTFSINLTDGNNQPLFKLAGSEFTAHGKKQLTAVAAILAQSHQALSIEVHTAANAQATDPQYTGWELSLDRANAVRRMLLSQKVAAGCVTRVVGLADQQPLLEREPADPRNNRVVVTILREFCGR